MLYMLIIRPVNNVGNILETAKLLKENKDIQFLIYGDGNQKEMIEKRITDEGLTNINERFC